MGKFSISLENQRNPDKDAYTPCPPRRMISLMFEIYQTLQRTDNVGNHMQAKLTDWW